MPSWPDLAAASRDASSACAASKLGRACGSTAQQDCSSARYAAGVSAGTRGRRPQNALYSTCAHVPAARQYNPNLNINPDELMTLHGSIDFGGTALDHALQRCHIEKEQAKIHTLNSNIQTFLVSASEENFYNGLRTADRAAGAGAHSCSGGQSIQGGSGVDQGVWLTPCTFSPAYATRPHHNSRSSTAKL